MKEHCTELVWVLDACEVAEPLAADTIRAYNAAIKTLREVEGELRITTVAAGEGGKTLYAAKEIAAVPALTRRAYAPKGKSVLAEALREAVDGVGLRLHNTAEEERPCKVVVAVVAFGKAAGDVEALAASIAHQRDVYNWSFLYLGSGAGGAKQASALSIGEECACGFAADKRGVESALAAVARAVGGLAQGSLPEDWRAGIAKRAQRPAAKKPAADEKPTKKTVTKEQKKDA